MVVVVVVVVVAAVEVVVVGAAVEVVLVGKVVEDVSAVEVVVVGAAVEVVVVGAAVEVVVVGAAVEVVVVGAAVEVVVALLVDEVLEVAVVVGRVSEKVMLMVVGGVAKLKLGDVPSAVCSADWASCCASALVVSSMVPLTPMVFARLVVISFTKVVKPAGAVELTVTVLGSTMDATA